MPEIAPYHRFQPCLLERLRDDEPAKREESSGQRIISYVRYRDGVMRDLRWLLNANAPISDPEDEADISHFPEARNSVLNLGIRSLSGTTVEGMDMEDLVRVIEEAIGRFEPRINKRSLRVRFLTEEKEKDVHVVALEISGELFADPVPQQLIFKTKLDLETGHVVGDRLDGS
jgi:type VI secretion system protein ImpF